MKSHHGDTAFQELSEKDPRPRPIDAKLFKRGGCRNGKNGFQKGHKYNDVRWQGKRATMKMSTNSEESDSLEEPILELVPINQ